LRCGPTVQTEMSLATAGIHCTISPPLSGAMEDCSIVRVQQLRMLCRRRCCICPRHTHPAVRYYGEMPDSADCVIGRAILLTSTIIVLYAGSVTDCRWAYHGKMVQESLANAKVSAPQQCMNEGP